MQAKSTFQNSETIYRVEVTSGMCGGLVALIQRDDAFKLCGDTLHFKYILIDLRRRRRGVSAAEKSAMNEIVAATVTQALGGEYAANNF